MFGVRKIGALLIVVVLTFFLVNSISIVFAQNCETYDFRVSEGVGWIKDCSRQQWQWNATQGHNGNGSMRSTVFGKDMNILGLQISSLCRIETGPVDISFWWKLDSNPQGFAKLSFLVNGSELMSCYGNTWNQERYSLTDNKPHMVQWVFTVVDPKLKKGAGWIDDVSICPAGLQPQPQQPAIQPPNVVNVDTSMDLQKMINNSENKTLDLNGRYSGSIVIRTKNITIKSSSNEYSVLDGKDNSYNILIDNTSGVTIEDLCLVNSKSGILIYNSNHCNIKSNKIYYDDRPGINIEKGFVNNLTNNDIASRSTGCGINLTDSQNNYLGMNSISTGGYLFALDHLSCLNTIMHKFNQGDHIQQKDDNICCKIDEKCHLNSDITHRVVEDCNKWIRL